MVLFVLYEAASGYGLFERVESEEIGEQLEAVQEAVTDFSRFGRMLKLKAFLPFRSAEDALANINDVSEGLLNETLRNFLEMSVPRSKKKSKSKSSLGVAEEKLGSAIQDALSISCEKNQTVRELLRGIRLHFHRYIPEMSAQDACKAQLGLGHSYSRCKVKFNVHRQDNMIIQSSCLLDKLDKDLNTFSMRVREWYSWHFPELIKIVPDNYMYCRVAQCLGNRTTFTEDKLDEVEEIIGNREKAEQILSASKASMGTDISDIDLINVSHFVKHVIKLADYRQQLLSYLQSKMQHVAPNLAALMGDQLGGRLISHAGSLTNLAKYPASTVQILGAEKALFRALKTRGNTPKYGLIFNSSFIGKASTKNKGRISRYLANKCSIASRIDCFSDSRSDEYGKVLKGQVEERLHFYDTGAIPRKNVDVMREAAAKVAEEKGGDMEVETKETGETKEKKKSKSKKRSRSEGGSKKKKSSRSSEDGGEGSKKKRRRKKKKSTKA